jgi:methanogenic corrinoid protein MtbC1
MTEQEVQSLRAEYLSAQLAGDRRRALQLITAYAQAGDDVRHRLRRDVVGAAQAEIGLLWQHNRISIAQEHMATAISHLALAEIFRQEHPAASVGHKVVVACVDGELHEFPARLVADELDLAGFDVRFLGASVPLKDLLAFIAAERPHLVVLSATMAFHADAVRQAVNAIRQATGGELPIAIGGQVCTWVDSLASDLQVEISGCDAATFVRDARQLLERRHA